MLIDKKYNGVITKNDGTIVPDAIVFRAQDRAVPEMLEAYREICERLGSNNIHLKAIDQLHDRVLEYQMGHSSKVPDTMISDGAITVE